MNPTTAEAKDPGGRDEQQDSVAYFHIGGSTLMVLGDGMGGHTGGAMASQILVSIAGEKFKEIGGKVSDPQDFFNDIINTAHSEINAYGERSGTSPHTTVVMLLITGGRAYWAHIGDSRLYHFSNGEYVDRTRDHSITEYLFRTGEITEEEMATHPDQNKLLRSLGGSKPPQPTFGQLDRPVQSGDAFLICSDGLWETVSKEIMIEQLYQRAPHESLQQAVDFLVGTAQEEGGTGGDNISCAVYMPPMTPPSPTIDDEPTLKADPIFDTSSHRKPRKGKKNLILPAIALILAVIIIVIIVVFMMRDRTDQNQGTVDSLAAFALHDSLLRAQQDSMMIVQQNRIDSLERASIAATDAAVRQALEAQRDSMMAAQQTLRDSLEGADAVDTATSVPEDPTTTTSEQTESDPSAEAQQDTGQMEEGEIGQEGEEEIAQEEEGEMTSQDTTVIDTTTRDTTTRDTVSASATTDVNDAGSQQADDDGTGSDGGNTPSTGSDEDEPETPSTPSTPGGSK